MKTYEGIMQICSEGRGKEPEEGHSFYLPAFECMCRILELELGGD